MHHIQNELEIIIVVNNTRSYRSVAAGPSSSAQPMDTHPDEDANQAYIREMRTQDQVRHCFFDTCIGILAYLESCLSLASVKQSVHTVYLWRVLYF